MNDGAQEIHLFTDYRWNDGSVSRRWHVDPEHFDAGLADLRPFSLKTSDIRQNMSETMQYNAEQSVRQVRTRFN